MKRRYVLILVCVFVLTGVGGWLGVAAMESRQQSAEARAAEEKLRGQIQSVMDTRGEVRHGGADANPFDAKGIVRVLLIGLDARSGSTIGHCDAIQFIEINTKAKSVNITAVPRGTYSPLPGSGHLPNEYYLSNACAIGGLTYGITQIEYVLGQKADYVVMVGFSEALGAFRMLNLPTTETMQWLRMRQSYAIGEPQRAHNHSTFLKQMLVKFTPTSVAAVDAAWEYLLYQLVDSDLSFAQTQVIVKALIDMEITRHPERIHLFMKPEYAVTDIPYDTEHLDEYLTKMLKPIAGRIPEGAYTGISEAEAQQHLIDVMNAGLMDPAFVTRAFEQHLWLQVEDEATRESVHFALLSAYVSARGDGEEQKKLVADYVIEMETLEQYEWAMAGRLLLTRLLEASPTDDSPFDLCESSLTSFQKCK